MSDQSPKKENGSQGIENFVIGVWRIASGLIFLLFQGAKRLRYNRIETWFVLLGLYAIPLVILQQGYLHLQLAHWLCPSIFSYDLIKWIVIKIPKWAHFLALEYAFLGIPISLHGLLCLSKLNNATKLLDKVGLKNALGETPKVVGIREPDSNRTILRVQSPGIGIDQFKSRTLDLDTAFMQKIQDIKACGNVGNIIEIYMAKKALQKMYLYGDFKAQLSSPLSFVLGMGIEGPLIQSLKFLPHLLLAGATGEGKTVAFKQISVSLLKTTDHIQLYLIDLKQGVGVRQFSKLPNVVIAKNENEAVAVLRSVHQEMLDRFQYLETKGFSQIDPDRDKKDYIVVGVDEASILFAKSRNGGKEDVGKEARALTDEIAKLGRAACIHLVLATQKVTIETIDTKIQENINGRMCFKVNTLQGSNMVLGNKMAYELPDIKGRAIWMSGTTVIEVQTPYMSDDDLENEILAVLEKYKTQKEILYQSMLKKDGVVKKKVGSLAEEISFEKNKLELTDYDSCN